MRPYYETAADLEREREIAMAAAQAWRCDVIKLKTAFPTDWGALRTNGDEVLAFVEIRDRPKYTMDQLDEWGGVYCSLLKWGNAETMCRLGDRPFKFVVRACGVLWCLSTWSRYMTEHDGIKHRGRTDRGDWQDVEPVVMLRKHRFRLLVP